MARCWRSCCRRRACRRSTTEPIAAPYKSYVTQQWGNDPIWESEFVKRIAPRRANFPLARWAPDAAAMAAGLRTRD